ncbi:MAG TPA: guanylate kinase, partial [Bacilli bacterium]|nr:guanylate kinase [Bacilli bacterium]
MEMANPKEGLLIIISGPSGVGKGTIRRNVMGDDSLNLVYSVSMTTRARRETETDGVDYFFVTREEFDRNIKEGNFLEWAEFVGNRYGTPKHYVDELRAQGKN